MMRKIAIGLAAAAIALGGSTLGASAAKGGGGGGPHGGDSPLMGGGPHGGGGIYNRPSSRRPYGMGPPAYTVHGRGDHHPRPYPYPDRHYKEPDRYSYL